MEYTAQIPFFLNNFLSKPASALPKGAQWIIVFDGFPKTAILTAASFEPNSGWNISAGLDAVTIDDVQTTKGCLFAQAIQIPGESMTTNPSDLQMGGFIRSTAGGGRDSFAPMSIIFLDTNISFADNVLRPWVLATSHFGLIARSDTDPKQYRTNLTCYKFSVTAPGVTPTIVQKIVFTGICPVSIDGSDNNYTALTTPQTRTGQFVYHSYSIDSSTSVGILKAQGAAAGAQTGAAIGVQSTAIGAAGGIINI